MVLSDWRRLSNPVMFLGQENDAAFHCYCSFYLLIFLILFFELLAVWGL